MPSQVVPIQDIDKYGLIADSPAIALPPGAFSDVLNVRFDNGAIRKVKGYAEIFEALSLTNIIKVAYWPNPNKPVWIVVNRENSDTEDHIYAVYLDSNNAITSTDLSLDSATGYSTSDNWQATLFNGGYSIIMNPGNGTPQHATDTQGSSNLPDFANLPNWDGYTAESTTVSKVYCGIIIPLGNLLLAGDLQEFDSSDNIIRDLRGVVRSSSVASPGNIPQNWNPFATGAGTADELIIADTGRIKAMKPLQGKVMVYTAGSISQVSVTSTGLSEIKVTDQYGAVNQDSVYEYDGRHLVLGSNDIYVFEGHPASIQSIADGRVRRYYYNDVHGSSTNLTRIVRDLTYDEIWICYRSNNNTAENLDMALTWNYRHNVWSKRELPNIRDIVVGSITGGGVDTFKYTFDVTGNTGTASAGTAEVQTIAVTGADGLAGGIKEVQSLASTGTRSNVVGDQNEIYTITLPSDFDSGDWSPIPSGSTYNGVLDSDNSKNVTISANSTLSNAAGVSGLSIYRPPNKNITYSKVVGNHGSPPVGTRYPNSTSFSYSWHNRTFRGNQDSWGTSHVRETDQQVSICEAVDVSVNRMGWRWHSGYSGYTQNPYYITMRIVGKHRTSTTGTFLTGTHWYTVAITRDDQTQGDAKAKRYTSDPGTPGQSSLASSGTAVETNIGFIYDLQDCDVYWEFNSYQPGTSSAGFDFNFNSSAPNGYLVTNNSGGKIKFEGTTVNNGATATINASGSLTVSTQAPTTFTLDLDSSDSTFNGDIVGYFDANTTENDAAERIKQAIVDKAFTGVTATRSGAVVTVDTGQNSNMSGSISFTAGDGSVGTGGYSFTQQNGFNNPTFSTTYTVKAGDDAQTVINTFTGSVASDTDTDESTVKTAIANAILAYKDVSASQDSDDNGASRNIDFTISGASVTTAEPMVITNGRAGPLLGLFKVEVDNNNANVDAAGDLTFGEATQTTAGVNGGSVTGTFSLGSSSDDFYVASTSYTAFNSLTGNSTNNSMSSDIAIAINNATSQWTVASASDSNNITFTDTESRNITQLFTLAGNRSDTGSITAGTTTRTTDGIDATIAGKITSTITPISGDPIVLTTTLDNKTQNQCATELKDDLNARNEFTAKVVNNNTVEVEYTQFGDLAPQLEVVFDAGTKLSGDDAVVPTHTFTFDTLDTRDLERPWPTSFINEDFTFLVGVTDKQFFAFDLGSEAGSVQGVDVSGITQANPGVVTTSSAHNLTDGQEVALSSVEGMTDVNGQVYYADVLTSTTYALYSDPGLGSSYKVDTSGFDAYTSGGTSVGSADEIKSYVERKNIHVSPTKDTENYVNFYLDTEGGGGEEFDVRIQMTNASGRSSDLSENGSADVFKFGYGGETSEHKIDTRLNGRIANFRIEDNSKVDWSIAAMGFEFDKGGTR